VALAATIMDAIFVNKNSALTIGGQQEFEKL